LIDCPSQKTNQHQNLLNTFTHSITNMPPYMLPHIPYNPNSTIHTMPFPFLHNITTRNAADSNSPSHPYISAAAITGIFLALLVLVAGLSWWLSRVTLWRTVRRNRARRMEERQREKELNKVGVKNEGGVVTSMAV
jgi:hypothetical protein